MKIDRVVITTFPGYFFITKLCIRSIKKYFPHLPIDIIIDDFGLAHWPNYVSDCQQYLNQEFSNLNYTVFSQLSQVDDAGIGGWFRQQLIKLHLDQLVRDTHWLLVDADVIFEQTPATHIVPVFASEATPVDIGNRLYVQRMLNIDQPWLGDPQDWMSASGVPFRYITKDLLESLRARVESVHNKNFLQLHLDLMKAEEIVAFDPDAQKSVMSEFQLIEVFRQRCYNQGLTVRVGTSNFYHDSVKDWNRTPEWFESKDIRLTDQLWSASQEFGRHHV